MSETRFNLVVFTVCMAYPEGFSISKVLGSEDSKRGTSLLDNTDRKSVTRFRPVLFSSRGAWGNAEKRGCLTAARCRCLPVAPRDVLELHEKSAKHNSDQVTQCNVNVLFAASLLDMKGDARTRSTSPQPPP
jgi:hypothetical protein